MIVLVGSERAEQLRIASVLRARGYDVTKASSSAVATAMIASRKPDLVVLASQPSDAESFTWLTALRLRGDWTPAIVAAVEGSPVWFARDLGIVATPRAPLVAEEIGAVVDKHFRPAI